MAIPSGSGTEVLKRASVNANSDAWATAINGVANHIYTIISIVAGNNSLTNDETIGLRVAIDGSTNITLIPATGQPLVGGASFVWNDRIVLSGTDHLDVHNSAGDVDWLISYIDQDWT
tara:strand:- start:864 stop:1217 length:354 start_codon:yes stop_codon:yes gene_type:complete